MADLAARFWAKVDVRPFSDECWIWKASKTPLGYGQFQCGTFRKQRNRMAHIIAWEFIVGPVQSGLELDHLCRTHACVNPWHLEPVTRSENVRRGHVARGPKTYCPRGHEYTAGNTYLSRRPDGTSRCCMECRRTWSREQEKKRRKRSAAP